MKWCGVCVLMLLARGATAQPVLLLDTTRATWAPSPDNDTSLVTSYRAEFWLIENIQNGVPQGNPAQTVDMGKPPVVGGVQTSAPVMGLAMPWSGSAISNVYVLFLSAVGPGGVSAPLVSPPFTFQPPAPRSPTGLTFVPGGQ